MAAERFVLPRPARPRPLCDFVMALRSLAYKSNRDALAETRKGVAVYDGSPARFHDWQFATQMKAKTMTKGEEAKTVSQIIDGLRSDALGCARRIGVDELCKEGGIDKLIAEVRKVVFPSARQEAKDLYDSGHRQG